MVMEILFKEMTYNIIGACYEVHNNLGCGFLEAVYQEALAIELAERDIPFEKEKSLEISYKGVPLKKKYTADFICYSSIVVELKALTALTSQHESQVINYLKATGVKIGFLFNFGETSLKYRRLIL